MGRGWVVKAELEASKGEAWGARGTVGETSCSPGSRGSPEAAAWKLLSEGQAGLNRVKITSKDSDGRESVPLTGIKRTDVAGARSLPRHLHPCHRVGCRGGE